MKNFIIILFLTFVSTLFSFGQCNPQTHKEACVNQLSPGYTFIKSFPVEKSKNNTNNEVEYSFVFSKGTSYMFTISDKNNEPKNIEIILYDPQHKKIISNYDRASGMFFPIQYTCSNTGVHYITFKSHGSAEQCGLGVLGFKR